MKNILKMITGSFKDVLSGVPEKDLNEWIKDEMIHGLGKQGAIKIVRDHVEKWGLQYYPEMKKVEERLGKK